MISVRMPTCVQHPRRCARRRCCSWREPGPDGSTKRRVSGLPSLPMHLRLRAEPAGSRGALRARSAPGRAAPVLSSRTHGGPFASPAVGSRGRWGPSGRRSRYGLAVVAAVVRPSVAVRRLRRPSRSCSAFDAFGSPASFLPSPAFFPPCFFSALRAPAVTSRRRRAAPAPRRCPGRRARRCCPRSRPGRPAQMAAERLGGQASGLRTTFGELLAVDGAGHRAAHPLVGERAAAPLRASWV